MSFTRFNGAWFALVFITLLATAILNFQVDPYSLFGSARRSGFNAKKPQASSYTPLVKAHQIERVLPATVLLGTSRVDIGLDPAHAAWPATARPVYNYGLPEASILTLRQQLQHALRAGPVQAAVVGLEFQDFLRGTIDPARQPDEVEQRFVALSDPGSTLGRAKQRALDMAASTLTLNALLDSVATLSLQRAKDAGDVTDQGLTSELPYAELVRRDGHHGLFLQKDLGIVRARQQASRRFSGAAQTGFVEMAYLRALIDFCRAQNIELRLFIPPYHAHYLEIVDATGLWERFENWKVALLDLVEEYRRTPGSRVSLWDFASYDEFSTEAVPPSSDRKTSMQWFWEPVHFKKSLGDIILSRMLASDNRDFGVELTRHSIDARLASGRQQRLAYRQRLPAEAKGIINLVHSVK